MRRVLAWFLVACLGACPFSFAQGPMTEAVKSRKRVALVVGNSAYRHTAQLANPTNDATDIGIALKKHGFDVIEGFDLDKAAFDRKVRDFAVALHGAEAGVFFFAGHGLQVAGQNYLVPVDAELTTAAALDFEMVQVDVIHRAMEQQTATNIMFLDACRDNPLARNLARAMAARSAQIGRGFAPVASGTGTLISFSTQPGSISMDGKGRNSPFTRALVKHIASSKDDLSRILIVVRNDVGRETEGRQVPWDHSSLTTPFYFVPPKTVERQAELAIWTSVKDSTTPAVLGTYLERYPNGEFAPLARLLIEHYERRLKVELASREEERSRREDERKAAEVKRIEGERRAHEAAVEAAKTVDLERLEKAKADLVAITENLRKVLEEARSAREAAKAAEEQRLAAVRAAEEATKAAQDAIARKMEAERSNPARAAALPKLDVPASDARDRKRQITRGGQVACGRNGCQRIPKGCYAVRHSGGGGLGGKIVCP
jgi:Caspase domain